MANTTQHYHLNQWAASDAFLRTDFNEDNAKIDAALAQISASVPALVLGTYTGNGNAQQTITLSARPRFLLVWQNGIAELFDTYQAHWGMTIGNAPTALLSSNTVELTESGFRVFYKQMNENYYIKTNTADTQYSYLAVL